MKCIWRIKSMIGFLNLNIMQSSKVQTMAYRQCISFYINILIQSPRSGVKNIWKIILWNSPNCNLEQIFQEDGQSNLISRDIWWKPKRTRVKPQHRKYTFLFFVLYQETYIAYVETQIKSLIQFPCPSFRT